MTARFAAAASVLMVSGLCALSLGGRVFYLIMYALLGMLLYALGSAFLARALLVVDQRAAEPKAERGSPGRLDLRLTNRSLLPVAPFEVALVLPTGQERMRLDAPPLREAVASVPFVLNHVGVLQVFVRAVYVADLFGFFRFRRTIRQQPPEVVVLPRPFDVTALKFLRRTMARPAQPQQRGHHVARGYARYRRATRSSACTGSCRPEARAAGAPL